MKTITVLFSLTVGLCSLAKAQDIPAAAAPALPGRGLAEHDFLYAGESKDRKIFIVKKGAVVWSYDDPAGRGEISDAVLLSNGNVLLAHQFAVKVISPDKKVLWNYDVPKGFEVHTAQAIGTERVLFIQNGDPAQLKIVNIATGVTEKELTLPAGNSKSVHGQFRHARLTAAGTLLVAHMDMGKVCEYDATGKELWSFPAPGIWGVEPLANGNALITDRVGVREVTRRGDVVWSYTKTDSDATGYKLLNLQLAWRLPNGNTLINNWANQWSGQVEKTVPTVQAVEVTPDKRVVWALRSWDAPNLGPATTIQILDEPGAPENARFGEFK
ncbi:MAG: PQQ-like beta-propeller repeat protein [Verrucomicrobia bacterium]|nr:PQQ-like beta-propeller repeat protein [Verrucomicrobiota bacterium]